MTTPAEMTIETSGESSFGPCGCCGKMTTRIWGYVYHSEAPMAAYFVEWTPDHEFREASFDLVLGRWGENAPKADRQAVSLSFRILETGPAFMVVDSNTRPVAKNDLVGKALARDEVIGHEIAREAFAICDVVYLQEPRLAWMRDLD